MHAGAGEERADDHHTAASDRKHRVSDDRGDGAGGNQIFLLVDVVCCCAVFFTNIWSIRNLCEASMTDSKATRNLKKLILFKQFYLIVIGYLYFTRIPVSAFAAVLTYRYQWVVNVSVEFASVSK